MTGMPRSLHRPTVKLMQYTAILLVIKRILFITMLPEDDALYK